MATNDNGFPVVTRDKTFSKILQNIVSTCKKNINTTTKIYHSIDYLKTNLENLTNNYKNNNCQNYISDCIKNFYCLGKINEVIYKGNYLYIFVTDLQDPENKNRVLIKIGFSKNILDREIQLKNEYDCNFIPIGLKRINGEYDEKDLHKYLNHGAYPTTTLRHLIYKMLRSKN